MKRIAWLARTEPAILASAVSFALILIAQALATFVPAHLQGNAPGQAVATQAHLVDRFYAFDALWYERIATAGYNWDPSQPTVQQDAAFFPLWPLVLRAAAVITGPGAPMRWAGVLAAAACAVASIAAFSHLANRLLPARDARLATWLFALYPAASFLLMSYPAGLMNLLAITTILALIDGRFTAAAAYAGLATAAGPLGLATALTVCSAAAWRALTALRSAGTRAALPALLHAAGHCVLSFSGLLAFLLWQQIAVGDAFAFIHAQAAWEAPPSLVEHLTRAFSQLLVWPDLTAAWKGVKSLSLANSLVMNEGLFEQNLGRATLALSIIALLASLRVAPAPVFLQGAFTVLIFVWFHGAIRPGNSTLRLIYGAVGMFIGAAWILGRWPRVASAVIGLSACLLAGGAFLTAAGYHFT